MWSLLTRRRRAGPHSGISYSITVGSSLRSSVRRAWLELITRIWPNILLLWFVRSSTSWSSGLMNLASGFVALPWCLWGEHFRWMVERKGWWVEAEIPLQRSLARWERYTLVVGSWEGATTASSCWDGQYQIKRISFSFSIFEPVLKTAQITHWVRLEIVQLETAKERAKMIEIFIDTAESLLRKSSLNSAHCIGEALTTPLIESLGRSWDVSIWGKKASIWADANIFLLACWQTPPSALRGYQDLYEGWACPPSCWRAYHTLLS